MAKPTSLPGYHVMRPRLVAALESARLGIVEAGSGFGKTTLLREFIGEASARTVHVGLDPNDRTAGRLFARLAATLRQAGLADLATPLAEYDDEAEAIESFIELLADRAAGVTLLIDDVHHLDEDAAMLLAELATQTPEQHSVLLFGRHLQGALRARRSTADAVLDGPELALTHDEVGALCLDGFDVDLEDAWVRTLRDATEGWTAAVVLAAARLDQTDGSVSVIQEVAAHRTQMAYLVEELIAPLSDEERKALTQFAHLPLLAPAVAPATGFPELLARSAEAGLPYSLLRDTWYEMPGPVQEHLAGLGPLDPDVARRVSELYRRRGELPAALSVLVDAGDSIGAASFLANLPQERVETLDASLIEGVVATLPQQALEQHPRVLLHLARAHEDRVELTHLEQALVRAAELADRESALAREVDGEMARYLVTRGRFADAEELARRIRDETPAEEVVTRSMIMEVLGRIAAHEGTDQSLEAASRHLEEAARLARQARPARWAAQILTHLAYRVHIERADYASGLGHLDEALELVAPGSRRRGAILTFRAIALQGLGRFDDARDDLEESRSIGEALADRRVQAYAAWQIAVGAARQSDAATAVAELQTAERYTGDWFDHPTGLEFLADAVDCCSLVEETRLAEEYLHRLRERMTERDEPNITEGYLAEAAMLARSGDPDEAVAALDRLRELPLIAPAERWRIDLLAALAELHRGGPAAGALAARAFDAAAATGNPTLPFLREPRAAEALVVLAAEAGSRAASDAAQADLPSAIVVLGRFAVTQGGHELQLAAGKPQEIVKALAVNGGHLPTDEVIEALWPEVTPDSGRKRLRNALNRLNSDGPTLVVREGETLRLSPDTAVDAALFETQARKAVAAAPGGIRGAAGLARAALARYQGDVLPADRYEEWAVESRERLRRLSLSLLDILVEAAATRGDVDEAIRHLERAISTEPYDEARYVRAARLLIDGDRRAAALKVLDRAQAMLDELGLPPPQEITELRELTQL